MSETAHAHKPTQLHPVPVSDPLIGKIAIIGEANKQQLQSIDDDLASFRKEFDTFRTSAKVAFTVLFLMSAFTIFLLGVLLSR